VKYNTTGFTFQVIRKIPGVYVEVHKFEVPAYDWVLDPAAVRQLEGPDAPLPDAAKVREGLRRLQAIGGKPKLVETIISRGSKKQPRAA
jgi:hypothetical protein